MLISFPLARPYMTVNVPHLFFYSIFILHGLPKSIVSDCDVQSPFEKNLFDTKLAFSSVYHPQSDGKVVLNHTINMCIRALPMTNQEDD